MADPVRIIFLGGLGEIGRNCMAIEQQNRVLLIDVGLMFPDVDMHGIDLVLPDFTWLRENADRIEAVVATHGHEDHVGALHYLLRELSFPIFGSAVTLGLARNRIEEAGLLGKTTPHRRRRRRATDDWAIRRRVHTRSRIPCRTRTRSRSTPRKGVISALGRLQDRPHTCRRSSHRPGPNRLDRLQRRHPPADGRLDQRRGTRSRSVGDQRRVGLAGVVRRSAGAANHHRQLRQSPASHPADRRRGCRRGSRGGHARTQHEEERPHGA